MASSEVTDNVQHGVNIPGSVRAQKDSEKSEQDFCDQLPTESTLRAKFIETLMLEDVVVKSQQRGDPDLNRAEQLHILNSLFDKSPVKFVTTYGKHFKSLDFLPCFKSLRKVDPLLDTQLLEVEKRINQGIILRFSCNFKAHVM